MHNLLCEIQPVLHQQFPLILEHIAEMIFLLIPMFHYILVLIRKFERKKKIVKINIGVNTVNSKWRELIKTGSFPNVRECPKWGKIWGLCKVYDMINVY